MQNCIAKEGLSTHIPVSILNLSYTLQNGLTGTFGNLRVEQKLFGKKTTEA